MKNPNSFILRTAATLLFFLVNIFAIYLLLRGHNQPGGGFIAGLAVAIGLILLGMARGAGETESYLRMDPLRWASIGLVVSVTAALLPLFPLFPGERFFEHTMFHLKHVPFFGEVHVGTTLMFDIGVLMVVIGISVKVVTVFGRSATGRRALSDAEVRFYASPLETPIEDENSMEAEGDGHGS